jgi:hypothetical protein
MWASLLLAGSLVPRVCICVGGAVDPEFFAPVIRPASAGLSLVHPARAHFSGREFPREPGAGGSISERQRRYVRR